MNEQHKQITLDLFKENTVFIVLTSAFVVFLAIPSQIMKPMYSGYGEALFGTVIALPLFALWLMHFWNKILGKIFPTFQKISYGVALMLSIMISMVI